MRSILGHADEPRFSFYYLIAISISERAIFARNHQLEIVCFILCERFAFKRSPFGQVIDSILPCESDRRGIFCMQQLFGKQMQCRHCACIWGVYVHAKRHCVTEYVRTFSAMLPTAQFETEDGRHLHAANAITHSSVSASNWEIFSLQLVHFERVSPRVKTYFVFALEIEKPL